MASNPVFNQFNKDLAQGKYAQFNQPQYGQYGTPTPYQAPAQQGYQGQDYRTADGQPVYGQAQPGYGQPQQPGYGQPQQPGYGFPPPQQPDLEQMYASPSAGPGQTGRMTLDDVFMKSLVLWSLMLATAVASWFVASANQGLGGMMWLGGMFIGIAIGFVINLKKTLSVPLFIAYALVEGVFIGAASQFFNAYWNGVVGQAVLATMCVFAVMFVGWKFGLVKVNERSRRVFILAAAGYFLFGVVNIVLQMTGVLGQFGFFSMGTFGIILCLLGVALASYSLAVDFDSIQLGVASGLPEKYSWLMAHGLLVSVVWLYLELLRLFAISRD